MPWNPKVGRPCLLCIFCVYVKTYSRYVQRAMLVSKLISQKIKMYTLNNVMQAGQQRIGKLSCRNFSINEAKTFVDREDPPAKTDKYQSENDTLSPPPGNDIFPPSTTKERLTFCTHFLAYLCPFSICFNLSTSIFSSSFL